MQPCFPLFTFWTVINNATVQKAQFTSKNPQRIRFLFWFAVGIRENEVPEKKM